MKSMVAVNIEIPGIAHCPYDEGRSLQDYDIVIFNPELPYYERFSFSDGSSSISRPYGKVATSSIKHWNSEITNALREGRTVFFLLARHEVDSYVTGLESATGKVSRYSTEPLDNYVVLPLSLSFTNGHGSNIKITDTRFKDLLESLSGYIEYQGYLENSVRKPIATTHSGGKAVGVITQLKDSTGHLVLLPYFDLEDLMEENKKGDLVWSKKALGLGTKLTKILLQLDKGLVQASDKTPIPAWVDTISKSMCVKNLEDEFTKVTKNIEEKEIEKKNTIELLQLALTPTELLYETGHRLEMAVEGLLTVLGYKVSNFKEGSLEIDHVIISPEGKRLIGEAEGKDNSAIGIDKFRQMESNIYEDFQREDITEIASGILFGNGFRMLDPKQRDTQFTDKCLINAKRLKTVLVQTSDLYPIATYLQDHPEDENFKEKCRGVLENASGDIAVFPLPPIQN